MGSSVSAEVAVGPGAAEVGLGGGVSAEESCQGNSFWCPDGSIRGWFLCFATCSMLGWWIGYKDPSLQLLFLLKACRQTETGQWPVTVTSVVNVRFRIMELIVIDLHNEFNYFVVYAIQIKVKRSKFWGGGLALEWMESDVGARR